MRDTFFCWGPSWGFAGFYFRVRGRGLAVLKDAPVKFSERYGHARVWRLGRWKVEVLR